MLHETEHIPIIANEVKNLRLLSLGENLLFSYSAKFT